MSYMKHKAIGNQNRYDVLMIICDRNEVPTSFIIDQMADVLSQPAISQTLKALEKAELITCKRAGKEKIYSATPLARRMLASA